MQIYGLITELLRTFYGIIPYIKLVRWVGCAGGGVARPLAAVGRRTGQVSGWAERGWSFWAWLVALDKRDGRGQAQKPSHREGEGSDGMTGVCFFGSVCWIRGRAEVKETSPDIEGQPETKIPKIPKIPIIVDVFGKSNDSRNTSRE